MKKWAGVIILIIALGWLALAEANAVFLAQEAQMVQVSQKGRARVAVPTMNILRVDDDSGAGAGADGSSWVNAYPTLQDALAAASSGDEIWVAAGVYYPDEGAMQIANSVTATFQLTDSLAIYGGFAATETLRIQRDWQANVTVLSGDIDHDNGGADSNKVNGIIPATSDIVGNNAYHVVTGSGTDSTAVLDGFTINAGQANGTLSAPCGPVCGGGIYNDAGSPTLTNITITANSANAGGGMFNFSSNPVLNNVTITANSASSNGGGMFNSSSNPALTNVTIIANSAQNGGGMFNQSSSNPTLINVTITANSASSNGGGMFNSSSNPTLTNVTITANSASLHGGGIVNNSSNPMLTNVTITANSASLHGGGIINDSSNPTLKNVTITANSASDDGGGMFNNLSNPTLNNVTITANSASQDGGGMFNDSSNPTLNNVIIWNNQASGLTNTTSASIFNNSSSTPTISYSLIANSGGSGAWVSALGADDGNNIADDPKFVQDGDPTTLTEGDYRLQLGSPAIDAGNNGVVTTATDLAGSPRIRNGTVDMGAYEAAPEIKLLGLDISITDGVTTTNTADGTDFGDVLVGQPMTHTFIISNTGSYSLTLDLPLTLSNSTDFALATSPATLIPPESSSSFQVRFTPSTTGTLTSTLEIGSDDIDENPFRFVVSGTGGVPEISVLGLGVSIPDGDTTPRTLDDTDFGDAVVLSDTISHTFTISNSGSYSLTLSGTPAVSLSEAGTFTVTNQPSSPIPAGGTSSFVVAFAPTATGVQTATVSISSDDTDESSYTFDIQGTGIAPEISVQGLGMTIADGNTTPSTLDDTDFGDAVVLSDTISHTFTISNSGSYSLTLSSTPKVSLSTAGTFTVTNQPSSPIPAGGTSSFIVEFAPSATGVQTTTVSINSDDTDENPYTFELQGTGIAPEIEVQGAGMSISSGDTTPSTLDDTDFGDAVVLSDTISHTFTISNSGSSPLTLSGTPAVSLSTAGTFTITNQPSSPIPAGGTSSFVVAFAPSATGVQTTTVSINSDDTDENPYTFELQGTGIAPEIEVQGAGMSISSGDTTPSTQDNTDFGDLLVNSSASHRFTISNTGTSPLTLNGNVTLSDNTHFSISSQPASPIAANSDSTFDITFNPSATGTHTTTVSISNDDTDENPYTFDLQGTGIAPVSPPPPANLPPQLDQELPDITVYEGAEEQILSLLDYFSDREGDLLFFTVIINSDRDVVPNVLVGQTLDDLLTLQFGTPGQTEITILAEEDVHHRTFQDSFSVTVLPLPVLNIADVSISEGGTRVPNINTAFLVTLSPSSTQTVTVEYATIEGSATSEDYVPVSGTLTIPAGELRGTINVPIIDDELPEADETFTIRLENATNAKMLDGEAVITIKDDDQIATSVTLASFSAQPPFDPSTGSGHRMLRARQTTVEMQGTAGAGWWIGALFALLVLWARKMRQL